MARITDIVEDLYRMTVEQRNIKPNELVLDYDTYNLLRVELERMCRFKNDIEKMMAKTQLGVKLTMRDGNTLRISQFNGPKVFYIEFKLS